LSQNCLREVKDKKTLTVVVVSVLFLGVKTGSVLVRERALSGLWVCRHSRPGIAIHVEKLRSPLDAAARFTLFFQALTKLEPDSDLSQMSFTEITDSLIFYSRLA
jgi:hypothetical protein